VETGSAGVAAVGRVVQAVGEHIISKTSLACGYAGIRADEPSDGGIIVSGLEVVEAGFGVVDIAPVAEGVMGTEGGGQGACCCQELAPGVVGVGDYGAVVCVADFYDVALEVGDVAVLGAVVDHRLGRAEGIIEEIQLVGAHAHGGQLAAVIDVAVGGAAVGTFCTHTVGIISECPGTAAAHGGQLSALLPSVGPGAVVCHISYIVIGNIGTAVLGQKVLPVGVAVGIAYRFCGRPQCSGGVGVLLFACDVTPGVIGPGPGLSFRLIVLPGQLVGTVMELTDDLAVENGFLHAASPWSE